MPCSTACSHGSEPVDGQWCAEMGENIDMPYDPDGDPNFDISDPKAIDAWLNDPNTQALTEDLGRQFRSLPPEEQIEDLAVRLLTMESRRDELVELLDGKPSDDSRWILLDAINEHVTNLRRRIAEVRDQRSDD